MAKEIINLLIVTNICTFIGLALNMWAAKTWRKFYKNEVKAHKRSIKIINELKGDKKLKDWSNQIKNAFK